MSPGGIGYETARALATHGPKLLILATRDAAKLQEARDDILKATPGAKLATVVVDFDSLASVRAAASEILKLGSPDVLINNAAVMMCPYGTTTDGLEKQFGVNYVGPWLLTNLLLPAMLATPHPRVVNVASVGHYYSDIRFDDVGFDGGKVYDKIASYGQSKTANMLHAVALADKYGPKGLVAISLHPGGINTNLSRHTSAEDMLRYKEWLNDDMTPNMSLGVWKTIPEGASTTLTAALDPRMDSLNGKYLSNCQPAVASETFSMTNTNTVNPFGQDKESAKKLWDLTNKLIGESF